MSTKARWVNAILTFFDSVTHEQLGPQAPLVYYDDFVGPGCVTIPAAGAAESGFAWVDKIVGAAPPTVNGGADAANGTIECTLTVADQEQEALCYQDDQRNFSLEQGCIFECRARLSVLPTLLAEAVFGLFGDYVKGPDNPTYRVFFTADGSGEIFCELDDNAAPLSVTSGITVLATAWHIYRIDFTSVTDIRFYIDGVHVATGTTFPYAATGANAILQPYFGLYKSAGAGLGTLLVDYVRIWQKRS